jgi:glycosyltransferase involved in cell wall biosynthesis
VKVALVLFEPGAERACDLHAGRLARHLAARGDEVALLASAPLDPPHARVRVEVLRPFALGAAARVRAFARAAAARCEAGRFERVYSLGGTTRQDVVRLSAGSRAARAELWRDERLAHSSAERARIELEAEALGRGRQRCVSVPSELVGKDAMRRHHVLPETLRVVRPGVDPDALDPQRFVGERAGARAALGLAPDQVGVLFAADGWRTHGLDRLLKVWPQVAAERPAARLVVLGDDPEQASFRAEAGGQAHFAGAALALEYALAACDLLARPTRFDPFSIETLSALALGRPVVTTAADGASELVQEDVNGIALYGDDLRQTLYQQLRAWTRPDKLAAAHEPARAAAAACTVEAELAGSVAALEAG